MVIGNNIRRRKLTVIIINISNSSSTTETPTATTIRSRYTNSIDTVPPSTMTISKAQAIETLRKDNDEEDLDQSYNVRSCITKHCAAHCTVSRKTNRREKLRRVGTKKLPKKEDSYTLLNNAYSLIFNQEELSTVDYEINTFSIFFIITLWNKYFLLLMFESHIHYLK